jgi:hypothetical protein
MFYIKMKLLQGDRPQKKFFILNQLTLLESIWYLINTYSVFTAAYQIPAIFCGFKDCIRTAYFAFCSITARNSHFIRESCKVKRS